METVFNYLSEAGLYYLATIDGDQPRVRPFGSLCKYDGNIYIATSNQKDVFKQIEAHPKVEICASTGREWMRISCELEFDSRAEIKDAMLEALPQLKDVYPPGENRFTAFKLKNATAKFESLSGKSESCTF